MVLLPKGKDWVPITSKDVIHSWWVPAFAIKQDAIPGFVNTAWTKVFKQEYIEVIVLSCAERNGFMPIVVKVVEQMNMMSGYMLKNKKQLGLQN